jgi:uncharacterized protein (TIGR03663 family)
METENKQVSWLQKPLRTLIPEVNAEVIIISLILILAVISRFTMLGERVMSHDEINHVIPSWELYKGNGYSHDPVTHGPFQFHIVALSYFLLGDTDFSSRTPAAIFSIAAVVFVLFAFRRYLGRLGALVASFLFLISPYMLFYGRYTRNEAFIELFGVVALYALLRYLDKGDHISLILLTIATALHFTTKETCYIYMAQMLIFVFVLFIERVLRNTWNDQAQKKQFLYLVIFIVVALSVAFAIGLWESTMPPTAIPVGETTTETVDAATEPVSVPDVWTPQRYVVSILVGLAVVVIIYAAFFLIKNYGWEKLKEIRAFNILILQATLILPTLAALPITILGWDPLDYSNTGMIRTGIVVAVLVLGSALIGYLWDPKKWFIHAGIFWVIFIVFYTTFFTNGKGFFTGLVGSLGYWLSQQSVERGGQPLYYYALIQIPVYEFLPALGMIIALVIGISKRAFSGIPGLSPADQTDLSSSDDSQRIPTLALLIYWSLISLVAYSIAGEKMPWLTVHITLPMILASGWGIGYVLQRFDWSALKASRGWQTFCMLIVAIFAAFGLIKTLYQDILPFSGKEILQLEATQNFLFAAILLLVSIGIIFLLNFNQRQLQIGGSVLLIFLGLLTVQTIRASYMSSFVNYDTAKEYLVYAHAASGPKEVLKQIEEISRRITGGKNISIAYDNDVNYPYWWYLRDYPNKMYYADQPSRDVGQQPLIAAGDSTMNKLGPIIKDNYIEYSYMRLWWPNQDYWALTPDRIKGVFSNRGILRGIIDIWLNRDYTQYALATGGTTFSLEQWEPSSKMKFYIRKDIAAQIWDYGIIPENVTETVEDPYLQKEISFSAVSSIGVQGVEQGQFTAPRGIAVAADNSFYVADSQNHRIQHFSENGEFIEAWGGFSGTEENPPTGLFNEPWGVAVGPDGSVYVTDTWNHRVQKFNAHGKFIMSWGYFGQAETPDAFWGPRGIAVDSAGYVYVADTGNKRIVVFDSNGKNVNVIGSYGFNPGEFDEPVGVAVGLNGDVYINDTWNQRVQVFTAEDPTKPYGLDRYWDIAGWYGTSLENKPFITVSDHDEVFITDPESPRILEFTKTGELIRAWGDYSNDIDGFGLASAVAVDKNGDLLVTDGNLDRVLRFDFSTLP